MKELKTCPALVPPPPVPPNRIATAAASPEPSRQPSIIMTSKSFLQDVWAELRDVVWPTKSDVFAMSGVTIGLLGFFALFMSGLDWLTSATFYAIGLVSK